MAYLTAPGNVFLEIFALLFFINTLAINITSMFIDDAMLTVSLNIDTYFTNFGLSFESVRLVIYAFSLYLIILKFVKKILDVYALQVDGDPNVDIQVLITNFFKAMVIAMSFTTIWSWLLEIVMDFGEKLIKAVNATSINRQISTLQELDTGNVDVGSPTTALIPIFVLLALIMWCVLLKDGMEFWIVRLGVPLACCGLMDSDQGVFKQYMKLFLKEIVTVLIRVYTLHMALSMITVKGVDIFSNDYMGRVLLAIVAIIVAFKLPKTLSDFILQPNGGGGARAISNIYMGSMLLRGVI